MKKIQVTKDAGIETTEENLFRQLLFRYLPYWPLFVILILAGTSAALFYLQVTNPTYEASASILIKDEKKGSDESKIMESLNQIDTKKIVENEIEILHSRTILSVVVKDLHLYASIFEENRFGSQPAFITSPVSIELLNADSIINSSKIPFQISNGGKLITVNNANFPLNQWVNSKWGTIRFSKNSLYHEEAARHQFYFTLVNVKQVTNNIADRLDISPSGKLSSVINLKFVDAIPERGEIILNNVISVYNKVSLADKNQLASNTLDFVDKRLHDMGLQLDSMETDIQRFRTQKDVVDLSAQSKQYLVNVAESDQKLSDINVQLAVLDEVEKYVQSKTGQAGIVPSTFGINDILLSQLIERLYDSELQYERLKKTTAENNPILISLQNEIDKIKPNILENIKSQRRSLEAGRSNLSQSSSKYASMLHNIPLNERELVEISRQQSIKNSIYSFLLQKREETALSLNSTVPDSRLIDKAESSPFPVSPKKPLIYTLFIFGAILLGVLFIGLKEIFASRILFRNEIEKLTMIPVLGEISYDRLKKASLIKKGEKSLIAEQFRFLRATLSKAGTSKAKRIMITSSISGEGKSFIAANLAASIALAGKKVILVDLDLHKPGIHSLFNLQNERGVVDFLKGQTDEVNDLTIKSPEIEKLHILPAGHISDEPSELILNGRLKLLINYLEISFDIIIFDTAPALAITDAYIIGSRCDANLYIIRHGYTPKIQVQLLDENTGLYKMKNIGIVFNGVKKRGYGYYGSGFGYGYNFDYGYGYPEKKNS